MVPLNLSLVDFLLSAAAQAALAELAGQELGEQASLALLTRLRRTWQPDQAAALLDQARLRRKAGDKFPHPDRLLFDDEALQQASSRAVAIYRAQQFTNALNRSPLLAHRSSLTVADLGCGLGADTIALAEAGLHVLAVERDPVRARLAEANVAAEGLATRVRVESPPPSSTPAAAPVNSASSVWTRWNRPCQPCWRCWSMFRQWQSRPCLASPTKTSRPAPRLSSSRSAAR